LIPTRDVHGGAAAAAADFLKNHRGSGRLSKIHRGSGAAAFFFEDIGKVHEFDRIFMFTSETP
jgi:hypothetical protein